jgi:dienelactone hydrolase
MWTNVFAMEALEPQWISFNAAPARPSELEIKRAKAQGIELELRVGTALRGLIAKPEGAGPFPAVVMIHDCRGVRHYQHEWVRQLANWGYVALLVNSFFTRHAAGVCEKLLEWSNREVVGGRTFDAYMSTLIASASWVGPMQHP